MAELGVLASIVGIAGAAIASSKALCELIDQVRNAPEEMASISNDARAFHDIVTSVQLVIRDARVLNVIRRDEKLCDLVTKLEQPLHNCLTVLVQLRSRLKAQLRSTSDGRLRVSSVDLRWLFKRKDVLDCRKRLEAVKSTLDAALMSIVFFCSLRSAETDIGAFQNERTSLYGGDVDVGSILHGYAESVASLSPRIKPLSERQDNLRDVSHQESSTRVPIRETLVEVPTEGILVELPAQKSPVELPALRDPIELPVQDITGLELESRRSSFPLRSVEQKREVAQLSNSENERQDFLEAVRNGNEKTCALMLAQGIDVNTKSPEGNTALDLAVVGGRQEIVRLLAVYNADIYSSGTHVLDRCMSQSTEEMAVFLVDLGFSLEIRLGLLSNLLFKANILKWSRLMEALIASAKDQGRLQELLSFAVHGQTVLFEAIQFNKDAVPLLLEAGADTNVRDRSGHTPLMKAAHLRNLNSMLDLVRYGADLNAKMEVWYGWVNARDILREKHEGSGKYEEFLNILERNRKYIDRMIDNSDRSLKQNN